MTGQLAQRTILFSLLVLPEMNKAASRLLGVPAARTASLSHRRRFAGGSLMIRLID
jgi:hypothetical protein